MALLSVEKLVVDFGAEKPAVGGVSLAVEQGEVVSLLGPSGCGKTTMMRAIAGLVAPASGTIRLSERDITHLPPNRREVGLVFQSYALFPHLSVLENIAFGLRLRRQSSREIESRVSSMVAMVGLGGLEQRLPRELSGGQQQRVALARAVAVNPPLLLLDEPLSNLDARLRLDMRAELARIQRNSGVTMLYVTHDQGEALALSNRVAVMREGLIEQVATPETIWRSPATAFVARFVGFETILTARNGVWKTEDGRVLGPAFAECAGEIRAWRPNAITVGEGPFRGRVVSLAFQGDMREIVLETAIGPLKIERAASLASPGFGDELAFDLPAQTSVRVAP